MDRGIAACDTLMKFMFLWLIPAIVECLMVVIIFATYFNYYPLAVSVFFFVFVYMIWTVLVTLWRKKFRKQVTKSDNDFHDICTDSLVNFETVKYFTGEDFEMKRYAMAVEKYQTGSVNVAASLSFLNISQNFLLQCCLATSLTLATYAIMRRNDCCVSLGCEDGTSQCCSDISYNTCPGMEVGDFVTVLTYTLQLFMPLNFLGSVYNAIVMAFVDLANLSELLAESPDVSDATDAMPLPAANDDESDVAVEFDNVVFHYPSQTNTMGLKGLSFKLKRGTTTAVVGSTGAGKTTVSRLLFRFYDVLGGAVKVNGRDVRTITQRSLREAIGVVPQATTMFNDTIKNNVLYGRRDATDEELEKAARDAQLLDFIQQLPDGWDTMVGDRGLKLSGGEKQRTAIARCLLKDPEFIILDEATSALDTVTENSVQEALNLLGSDRTCLVIAHRLGTVRNADKIIVLKDGLVAEEGTHEELLAMEGGQYRNMWEMQLHSTANSSERGSTANLKDLDY
jgi:ABC-type transport system involved in Fe-S cluster assembly fused permease/ATPase subunit